MKQSGYQSEITQFLEELKQQRPHLDAQQRAGRALLWDSEPLNLEKRARVQEVALKYTGHFTKNKPIVR